MLIGLLSKLRIARGFVAPQALRGPSAGRALPILLGQEKKSVWIKCRVSGKAIMAEAGCPDQLPPPPQLQRDLFSETLHLKALRIPKRDCHKYMKLLAGCVLCPIHCSAAP